MKSDRETRPGNWLCRFWFVPSKSTHRGCDVPPSMTGDVPHSGSLSRPLVGGVSVPAGSDHMLTVSVLKAVAPFAATRVSFMPLKYERQPRSKPTMETGVRSIVSLLANWKRTTPNVWKVTKVS